MAQGRKKILSFSIASLLFALIIIPAHAEVQSIQIDKKFYVKGDKITFSGFVEDDDNGLVTIVIRDPNDEFVLLSQALIKPDNSYERSVDTYEKFSLSGIYNATAFIINMTVGEHVRFDYSLDGTPVYPSVSDNERIVEPQNEPEPEIQSPQEQEQIVKDNQSQFTTKIASFIDSTKDPQHYLDRYYNEPQYREWFDRNYSNLTIEEAVGLPQKLQINNQATKIPGFPDPDKDPQYYIDRYNTEGVYREWFDRNFPGQTIYAVIGIPEPTEEEFLTNSTVGDSVSLEENSALQTIPSSSEGSTDNELSQLLLALGGLGILFGAVYGIKRKVDHNSEQITENNKNLQRKVFHNSEQISQNRFWIKKKLFHLKTHNEPIDVIKSRLAKGEITVDEYYKLLRALQQQ